MKRTYVIEPFRGFNEIRFDDPREDVRKKFGAFKEFKKNRFSKNITDDFGDFHAFYDESNTLQAVEFFEGEVCLNGDRLFPNTKEGLIAILSCLDNEAVSTAESVESKMLGINAYAPGDTVETLLIYRQGYYD